MAEKKQNDSVKEITDKLEQGLKELFDSEKFKAYLNTMSKFHNYSFNNTLLIAMQKPDATLVAGFQSWQKNFERHVNKGEKGIKIMAPSPYKKKQEMEVIDQKTGRPVLGDDGKPKTEEVEITIPAFRPVTVFDVSQTSGKEIPTLGADELKFSVEGFEDFMKAMEKVAPVPIEYMDISSGAKGYFSPSEQKIAIQKDMGESQTVKTAVHETAHSMLHDKDNVRVEGIEAGDKKTRSTKEVEAESVAYTVCQHFGIDTSDYSFAYVAGWSSGKEMPELKESMDTIRKTASQLITGIEDALKEIKLEREQSQEIASEPTYEIWQLKNTPENRDIAFESTKHLKAEGKTVDKDNYELVYSGKLEEGTSLEDLYTKFNIDHPDDFRGHSMSVSDVVVIKDADGERAHFVDSVGFTEVPEFLADKTVDMEKAGPSMDSQVTDNSQEADRPARALDEGSVSQPGESTVITEDSPFRENPQTDNPLTGNNEPVTFIVAECSEFHALGECHEGITTTEEAVEIFESIPADRMNGIKSIGISVPNADDGYPVELDVLVGHTFDLDLIEYIPQIKENNQAMEMIAELMDRMPEMEVRGEIPVEIQEHLDQIHEAKSLAEELSPSMQLASEIDQFMYDYDTYGYQDQVPDRETQVATLAADLDNGEADYMKQYLSEIVEHQEGAPEDIEGAKKLIEKIDDFKPLAKIEEQLEENYNHIDNTLNNLKKPSEERAETAIDTDDKQEEALNQADSDSGRKTDEEKQKKRASKRPSLKKRLEEKKEQVAAQPVKPAPEKEKVKSNGRGLNDE